MDCVGIIPNIDKDIDLSFTKKIIHYVTTLNHKILLTTKIANLIGMPNLGALEDDFYKTVDFIIVLGGDGTILRASKHSSLYNKPLLGINLGTLGYLTDVEKEQAFFALDNVFAGNYKLEKRMMLETTILDKQGTPNSHLALNDICITKSFNKLLSLELIINDEFIHTYRADGIIISTPTGSTAYNLSAGGPIIKPDIEMIVLTPICPQMVYVRPFVVSANDIIKINILDKYLDDTILSLDGQSCADFILSSTTVLKKSNYYTTIIKTNNLSFYDVLKYKLVL
jgi:NAD+ kinase